MTKREPSLKQQLTVKALADNIISDALLSVQKGCQLSTVITRPDLIVNRLIDAGMLPAWTEVSNEAFVVHDKQTRTAMYGITIEELVQRRHDIADWASVHTHYDGGQVYRMLFNMLLHGFSAGLGAPKDDPVSEVFVRLCRDPEMRRMIISGDSVRTSILTAKLIEMGGGE